MPRRVRRPRGGGGACQVAVDDSGTAASLGDRPDDERLAATGIAGGEDAGARGRERRGLDDAARAHAELELLDGTRGLGACEPHGDQHQIGGHRRLGAGKRPVVGRWPGPGADDPSDATAIAFQRERRPVPEAVAALVERVRRGQPLGRGGPGHDLARPAAGRRRVAVEYGHARGPLAVGVADAIHRRVAAPDDDDVAAFGTDRLGDRRAGRPSRAATERLRPYR